jgi:prepilin-type N-terminal cleavage/methylation domain-containing protein
MSNAMSRLRQREEGFTLIELMIVMVVLGILAGIVLFAVGTFQSDAETSKNAANTRQCKTAIAAYKAKNSGASPTSNAQLSTYFDGTAPTCI